MLKSSLIEYHKGKEVVWHDVIRQQRKQRGKTAARATGVHGPVPAGGLRLERFNCAAEISQDLANNKWFKAGIPLYFA